MIEEALAGIGGDADQQLVGKHARAAGHGAAVAAGLADDRRGFAGDGRLIHRGGALNDVAVAGDLLAGDDADDVALAQVRRVHLFEGRVLAAAMGDELPSRIAERPGLGLAATLGHGLGEIRKKHCEEQPDGDLQDVTERLFRGEELEKGENRADQRDEHHRVFELMARMEFPEGIGNRLQQDFTVKQGDSLGGHGRGGGRWNCRA